MVEKDIGQLSDENPDIDTSFDPLRLRNEDQDRILGRFLREIQFSGEFNRVIISPDQDMNGVDSDRKVLEGVEMVALIDDVPRVFVMPGKEHYGEEKVQEILDRFSERASGILEARSRNIDDLRSLEGIALNRLKEVRLQTVAALAHYQDASGDKNDIFELTYPKIFDEVIEEMVPPGLTVALPHLAKNEELGKEVALYFLGSANNGKQMDDK